MWSLFVILVIADHTTADGYSHDFQDECTNITAPPEVPPRPLNVYAPSSLSVSIESESNDESEPYEVLKCNKKVRVFDGDAYTIKSPGYPDPAQANETCSWFFYVQDRVGIDIICDEINLPCPYKNFMYLKFGSKRPSKLCTGKDPEKTFRDQELSVKAYPSPYWLSVGYGSKNLGNGRGFSCLVMGSGGLTRSDPFQLGRLSTGEDGEDSKDNSVILPCPYLPKARRVVGGQKAGASEFPWMVALIIGSKNLCGGSIIADRWILTAAHCVEGKMPHQLSVRYGCNDRTDKDCIMTNRPDLTIIHPDYGFPKNDIALVRLQHRMDVKKQADRRVCLPSKALDRNGYNMTVAGWGKTNDKGSVSKVLRKASVRTAPDRNCTDVYGKYFSGLTSVCANGIDGNSCQGDSGSYVGSRTGRGGQRRMEVNGVVSFGARSSCEKAYPMGLTDIYTYNSWIVGVVGKYDEKTLSEISSIVS